MHSGAQPEVSAVLCPRWLLLLVGIPAGVVINGLTGGFENLPQALMMLMGWLHEPSRVQRYAAAIVSNVLVPGLLAYLVLRLTRLGRWLAVNRLAIGGLVVGNGLLLVVAMHGFYQASIDQPPFLMGWARALIQPATISAVAVGLGSLLVSTIWYRLVRNSTRAVNLGRTLLREVQW